MKRALVTAIGSFASDIVIKTLKEEGFFVIGCDIYPREWVAQSLDVQEFYKAPYASEEEDYVRFLKELCREKQVKLLLPLTDVEVDVINHHRKELLENGLETILCLSGSDTIALCRDKGKLEAYLREKGLCQTIPSLSLDGIKGTKGDFSETVDLPWDQVVLKPVNGRSSSGLYRVYEKAKLPAYLGLIEPGEHYLIQPLIEGTVITVDVVRDEKGNTVAVPRKEHLRTLNGAGTSVEVFRDLELEELCRSIAEALKITGCVNFEFIEEGATGVRYFMECNPRFSGGTAFSVLAGCNVVKKHIQAFETGRIEPENQAKPMHIGRKYLEYPLESGEEELAGLPK